MDLETGKCMQTVRKTDFDIQVNLLLACTSSCRFATHCHLSVDLTYVGPFQGDCESSNNWFIEPLFDTHEYKVCRSYLWSAILS